VITIIFSDKDFKIHQTFYSRIKDNKTELWNYISNITPNTSLRDFCPCRNEKINNLERYEFRKIEEKYSSDGKIVILINSHIIVKMDEPLSSFASFPNL